jgi:hypothetical protein
MAQEQLLRQPNRTRPNKQPLKTNNKPPNKALHPTASVPLVPHFTPAAGDLGRCVGARSLE